MYTNNKKNEGHKIWRGSAKAYIHGAHPHSTHTMKSMNTIVKNYHTTHNFSLLYLALHTTHRYLQLVSSKKLLLNLDNSATNR